jgi:hypothetical protein
VSVHSHRFLLTPLKYYTYITHLDKKFLGNSFTSNFNYGWYLRMSGSETAKYLIMKWQLSNELEDFVSCLTHGNVSVHALENVHKTKKVLSQDRRVACIRIKIATDSTFRDKAYWLYTLSLIQRKLVLLIFWSRILQLACAVWASVYISHQNV